METQAYSIRELRCEREGKRIYGQAYVPAGEGRVPLVIFCHELGRNHTVGIPYAERLCALGFAVYVFDYDREKGTLSNQQLLCKISSGIPDGMCIDAADDLWIAVWGGRVEHRSGRTGELLGEIRLPAERVTSCCFIGSELDTLFITTFGDGMDGPDDGGLFLCKTGVRGCAADPAVID